MNFRQKLGDLVAEEIMVNGGDNCEIIKSLIAQSVLCGFEVAMDEDYDTGEAAETVAKAVGNKLLEEITKATR